MGNLVIDTSIYVDFFRGKFPKSHPIHSLLGGLSRSLYLSSVVAQELHAGAIDPSSASHLDRFFENFESLGRVITPARQDWYECGRILSKIGKKFGFESVRRSRLVNDVLIALSCHQVDATLLTANVGDFRMISEFVDFEMETAEKV